MNRTLIAIGTGISSCVCMTALPFLRTPGKIALHIFHTSIAHEEIIIYGIAILALLATKACKKEGESLNKKDYIIMGSASFVGGVAGAVAGTALAIFDLYIQGLRSVERYMVRTNPLYRQG